MTRISAGVAVAAAVFIWWPFPALGVDPVVDLVALRSPVLHQILRGWHYAAPAVAVVGGWSMLVAIGRVWVGNIRVGLRGGKLPAWPGRSDAPSLSLVVGEVHHPVEASEVANPTWLTIPEQGLFTGVFIAGAVGSGKTTGCMRPFAEQLFGWQASDPRRRAAGLVLEVKGDFCHQVREILEEADRGEDYIELGLGGRWQWNPLSDWRMDAASLAGTIASLINQLGGKSKDPFWQLAYLNFTQWVIVLHRMCPDRWVTLQDVYQCLLEPERLEAKIAEVKALVAPAPSIRIAGSDLSAHAAKLLEWPWANTGDVAETADDPELREQLTELEIQFAVTERRVDPARQNRLAAVQRWYQQDWLAMDQKLRTSISESLSVFLSLFDLPEVAAVFCPPSPAKVAAPEGNAEDAPEDAPEEAAAEAAIVQPLPPLDELIESGKVIGLNMPAGTNPRLARTVGVMLKQAWLLALLRRPTEMVRRPGKEFRPAVFLCDEYQTFVTVGEDDSGGDEKMFSQTRQSRVIPIVATQSISSLRSTLGQGEAWRTLLQTLRTRIFLSLGDDSSAQTASTMCGQVEKVKATWTMSEQTARAFASLLSGSAGGGSGSVGTGKTFSQRREALFHPRDFTLLDNCQAIVQPYDGRRTLDARRVYLKPHFLPRDRPYWRAREAGEL
jgi:hypothetical protein